MTGKIKSFNQFWEIVKPKSKPAAPPSPRPTTTVVAPKPQPQRVQLRQPVRVLVKRTVELSTMQSYKVIGQAGADRLLISVGNDVVEVSRAAVKEVLQ